ncbi:hypothetical protein OAK19_04140 [Aureispira]|nr:hypothetical protein [Aureispira sp.]
MNKLFSISICIYFASYLLPFADQLTGIELEFMMWHDMLNNRIPNEDIATIWSLRWLSNVLILSLCCLKIPEFNTWITLNTDKDLLDKLLFIFVCIFSTYPFFYGNYNWQWGGLTWATSAIISGLTYQGLNIPVIKDNFHSLEEHLIELKETAQKIY